MKNKKELLDAVQKEANLLRVHANQKELDRLVLRTFDPEDIENCIYGQMTGNCRNARASELISKCSIKLVPNDVYGAISSNCAYNEQDEDDMDDLKDAVEGLKCVKAELICNTKEIKEEFKEDNWHYYSAIETYITVPGADIKGLMSYLRGERDVWSPDENKTFAKAIINSQ